MLFKNKVVLMTAKESTYGVDPGSGYQGVLANDDLSYSPSGDKIERNTIQEAFSPRGHVIGIKEQGLSFSVEGKGNGLDGSDPETPEFDALLQACALKLLSVTRIKVTGVSGTFEAGETVEGGTSAATGTFRRLSDIGDSEMVLTSVSGTFQDEETLTGGTSSATATADDDPYTAKEYAPTSTAGDMESCAIQFYWDSHKHVLLGCRGDLKVDLSNGNYPSFQFDLRGLWADPTDESSPPTPTLSELVPPVVKSAGLKIGSFTAPVAEKIETGLNNNIARRPDMNATDGLKGLRITDRNPTGSVDPEAEALATFDPYTDWKAATENRIVCSVGAEAGNRFLLEVPQAVFEEVGQADREGIRTYSLPFVCTGQSDDEWYLTFF